MAIKSKPWIKVTILLISSMTVMSGAIIAPSLPKIEAYFTNVKDAEFWTQLVLTMPGIFIAAGSPLIGILVDRTGRKKLLLLSLFLYGLAGCAGYFLDNLFHIIISRAVLGIAVAGIMTITNTLTADYFEDQERGNFVSLRGSFVAFGGVFFVTAAGFLADISWRIPFLIYAFSFLMLPLAIYFIYEPEIHKFEKTAPKLKPTDYPRNWIRFVYFIAFLGMTLFYMIPVQMPFYLENVVGVSSAGIGISIGFAMMAGAFTAAFHARFKRNLSFNGIYALCFLLMASGFLIVSFSEKYYIVLTGLIISGGGIGLIGPNHTLCLMNSAPAQIRGRVLGTLTTFIFIGQFSSPLIGKFFSSINGSLPTTFMLYAVFLYAIAFGFLVFSGMVFPMKRSA